MNEFTYISITSDGAVERHRSEYWAMTSVADLRQRGLYRERWGAFDRYESGLGWEAVSLPDVPEGVRQEAAGREATLPGHEDAEEAASPYSDAANVARASLALLAREIDGILADLPTPLYATAAEVEMMEAGATTLRAAFRVLRLAGKLIYLDDSTENEGEGARP